MFEIVHEESVKAYHLHMYNGNIQQNSLCAEFCVSKEFHISPRFSPAFFRRDAMCLFGGTLVIGLITEPLRFVQDA